MYIGKFRFYTARPDNELGSKLVVSFYTKESESDNGKFVTTRVFHKNVDKCFNVICKLIYKTMFRDNKANFEVIENKVYDDSIEYCNISKKYSSKVVFKHNSLTH